MNDRAGRPAWRRATMRDERRNLTALRDDLIRTEWALAAVRAVRDIIAEFDYDRALHAGDVLFDLDAALAGSGVPDTTPEATE